MDTEDQAIVIDHGSANVCAGFAGDDAPRAIYKSVVGLPKYTAVMVGMGQKSSYVGDEANSKRGVLTLRNPMSRGIVQDWDFMEKLYHHTFYNELRVAPEEHPILITGQPFDPHVQREKYTEMLFELFKTPAMYIANSPLLALYAAGSTCGTVVSCGEGVTTFMPVYEGYCPVEHMGRLDLAGYDITLALQGLLKKQGYSFESGSEWQMLVDMKEKLCRVSRNVDHALRVASTSNSFRKTYTLPDGNVVHLNEEIFLAPEVLFQPGVRFLSFVFYLRKWLAGRDIPSITEIIYEKLKSTAVDDRSGYFGGIRLFGGTSKIPGLAARLAAELEKYLPVYSSAGVALYLESCPAWIGGSILASLSTFQQMWIGREEYDESGPAIVHRKCL